MFAALGQRFVSDSEFSGGFFCRGWTPRGEPGMGYNKTDKKHKTEKHLAGSRPFHDSATFEKAHLKYL